MKTSSQLIIMTASVLAVVAFTLVTGSAAPRNHERTGRAGIGTTTTTTTTLSGGSSTTTTTLPCSPQGFGAIDSALGALLDEVNGEHLSGRLKGALVHQENRTKMLVDAAAAARCDKHGHKANSLLKAAIRAMISFEYRVRSLTGRQGGADASRLLQLADAVLKALGDVKGSK